MDLTHRFTVPTSVDETWAHFADIASVAECFPGAAVTSVEGDTFSGSVKVKLGPIALVYNGSGTFVEKDDAAHRFVVDAKGKDKRGNGTAGAKVTLTMAAAGTGTDVEVVTDLSITGKPAQFGRGVMQDVSDKLLGQFVQCLEQRLASGSEAVVPDESGPKTSSEPRERQGVPEKPPAPKHLADPPPAPPAPPASPPPSADDSLDLGATVLPVLARSYWKPAAGVVAGLLVLWWVVSRSRR
ncbi:SRPBCC family protein [Nocardioides sp. SR21]|uniref:SRPBCC family protein n=1 Tax=Nocardioides sp. SR21 TaxID=2919501 RepID=UPI001FA9D8F7|nr:SRPBCC family protein [Nocardioides sp. SR21]